MAFYVIDIISCATSWDIKKEKGERFLSRKMAEKRAKELAEWEPGKIFEIVQSIAEIECPVGAPRVTNR